MTSIGFRLTSMEGIRFLVEGTEDNFQKEIKGIIIKYLSYNEHKLPLMAITINSHMLKNIDIHVRRIMQLIKDIANGKYRYVMTLQEKQKTPEENEAYAMASIQLATIVGNVGLNNIGPEGYTTFNKFGMSKVSSLTTVLTLVGFASDSNVDNGRTFTIHKEVILDKR